MYIYKLQSKTTKTNSTLMLFLFFFFLPLHTFHYVFLMPFNNILIFYSSMFHLYFHGKLICALSASGHCTQLTLSFFNQDGGLVEEPTTSPFLPSPSLKLPLSNSALPNQTLGGIASGLGMQNLNSSRQVRNLSGDSYFNVRTLECISSRISYLVLVF